MFLRKQFQKTFLTGAIIWTFLLTSLPVSGQSLITGKSLTGGSTAFVYRKSKTSRKNSALSRRRSRAKRSKKQRKSTRRKVVKQSRVVAKKNRVRRKIKKIAPKDFAKIDVVQLQRKSPEEASKVFAGLAEYHLGQDAVDPAILAYEQAVELNKDNKDAIHGLSEVYTRKGDDALETEKMGAAKRYYDEAIRLDPKNSSAYAGRGQYFDSFDNEKEAKADYLKALSIDPGMNQVKLPLGIIYYQEGEIAKSDDLVRSALAGGADNAETQYFLGLIRYKQGEDRDSEAALRKSISLDDSNDDAHYFLGVILSRNQKEKEAITEYERATELDKKYVPAWFALGVAYYNQQRWNDSIKAFEKAKNFNTNSTPELKRMYAESFANIGESYRQLDNMDAAIANYETAVSRITDDAELYTNYGFVLGRREKWIPAIENFKKAVILEGDTISYANLGWAYYNKASYDKQYNQPRSMIEASLRKAVPALEQAVSLDPKFVAARLNLGVVFNELGEHSAASKTLERVGELRKNWLPAMQELGIAYAKIGKYGKAIKLFKKVIAKDKANLWAQYYLADAEWRDGNKKNARNIQGRLQKKNTKLSNKLANRLETVFRTIDVSP